MKTVKIAAAVFVSAMSIMFSSCGGGVSTTPQLTSDSDSLWYAYGMGFEEKVIKPQMMQMGLLVDTATLRVNYLSQIATESDDLKRDQLRKEMNRVVDSVASENQIKVSAFFKGLQQGVMTSTAEEAYISGANLGVEITQQYLPQLVSYVYGPGVDAKDKFNKTAFLSAVLTGFSNEKSVLKTDNIDQFLNDKAEAIRAPQFEGAMKVGEEFLAKNGTREGVVTLPSGVQYEIITEGKGEKPAADSNVKVHYAGTLIDGTEFDSSIKRGEPASFNLQNVIKGWGIALQEMPVGSKWKLYIPQELAYGSREQGNIKAYSALIFEVELLEILK